MRESRPDDELRQIALDYSQGRIFSDRQLNDARELPMVFMVVGLMTAEQIVEMGEEIGEGGMLYEYFNKAGPRSVNGLPMFHSLKTLTSEEVGVVAGYVKKFKAAEESVKPEGPNKPMMDVPDDELRERRDEES